MLASDQIIRRVQSAESYEQFYQDYMRIFYDRISKQYPELIKDSELEETEEMRAERFTSKALVQQMLAMIKNEMNNETEGEDETAEVKAKAGTQVQELYGFDKRGQLKWQHARKEFPSKTKSGGSTLGKGVVIDVLQQYSAIGNTEAFPNLPSNMQVPNANNSIDARQYGNELMQYYRDGNGTFMGKMVFGMLPMSGEPRTADSVAD